MDAESDSGIPGLVVSEAAGGGRVAYLAADLDRRYLRELMPDHANLLANLVRWAAGDSIRFLWMAWDWWIATSTSSQAE